jgi:3-oxoadipate enol-lactonase
MALPEHLIFGQGKTTIYLLHGMYGAKEYWKFQVERLTARGYRVIAWDAPGYGTSSLPDPFTFDVVADAAADLVKATASERNIIFGHSMGGQVTPRILLKTPGLIHGAVICATIGYFGNRTKEEQEEFVRTRSAPPAPGTDPAQAILSVINSMFGPGASGAEVALVRDVAALTPQKSVRAAIAAVQAYSTEQAVAAIRAIKVPTLLVAGEKDQTGHTAGMKRVADMIPGSQFAVIPGSGHYPWAECPVEFNKVLFGFFENNAASFH